MLRQTKFVLDESRIPRAWYNIAADLPVAAATRPPSRHRQPIGPADLAPLFPMALITAGRQPGARDRDPRAGPRRLPALPAEPAVPCPSARAGARYAGAHLLQVRGRQPGRQPQAEHGASRRPSTTRSRASSASRPRRGPASGAARSPSRAPSSGSRSRSTWSVPATTRSRTAGSSWRPTARRSSPARSSTTNYGRSLLGREPRQHGLARHRDQRGDRGRGDPRRHEVLARLGAQPRPAPPDRHRPGSDRADGDGRRGARRHHRLRRWRLELRRADLPVPRPELPRGAEAPDHRRRAGSGAEPDPRHLRLRLRRHRADGAAGQDAHARPRLHPGADPCRRPALPRHVAAGQPAQGARLDRGAKRPPAGELRGRRPVRPSRGHPAGAGADPRDQGRHRRGASPHRRRASPG